MYNDITRIPTPTPIHTSITQYSFSGPLRQERDRANGGKCYFFNTFFYVNLTKNNTYTYKNVTKWSQKAKITVVVIRSV